MDRDQPIYVISVAAKLAGMHAQTLRQYDRLGLVSPSRAVGQSRRYSQADIERLQQVQELSKEGVSLEGVRRILQLQRDLTQIQAILDERIREVEQLRAAQRRVFAAGSAGNGSTVALRFGERPRAPQRRTTSPGIPKGQPQLERLR